MVSRRISTLTESITLAISAKAKQMKARGIDVVNLSVGEPDFDTPRIIKQAAIRAIQQGFTKYTPAAGIPELKQVIINKLKRDNGLVYQPSEIVVSCGAKHSIFNAIQALCNPGDEIIIPSPYWVSYPEQVKVSQAKCVFVPCKEANGFRLKAADVANKISRKTKVIIINSPNNPTGAVYEPDELAKLAKLAVQKQIFVISDEIYEKLVYGKTKHISIASFGKRIKDVTVIINGVSKAYAMTGWRIGFAAAPAYLVKLMSQLQSHVTSNPTSIAQMASVTAYQKAQTSVSRMVNEFARRRNYLIKRLSLMPYITSHQPDGAFYAFPNIRRLIGRTLQGHRIKDSLVLSELILTYARVAVVPGIAFGSNNHIRLSYANSIKNIAKGIDRLTIFLDNLR